jgi:hypothetical protein
VQIQDEVWRFGQSGWGPVGDNAAAGLLPVCCLKVAWPRLAASPRSVSQWQQQQTAASASSSSHLQESFCQHLY